MPGKFIEYFLIITATFFSAAFQDDKIENADKVYDQNIKTVRVYPLVENPDRELLAAAAPLNGAFTLLLEFDDLRGEYNPYFVKFIHCNADWSPSSLFPLDYLEEYNEFSITNYEFSFNTRVPYIHYRFEVPRFKLPGNYLLVVYKDREENIVLTRRILIFDNQVGLTKAGRDFGPSGSNREMQEIRFELNYQGKNIDNPYVNIKATIRQNQRWDQSISDLHPTSVNEGSRIIEFHQFAGETQFPGGNQFRFFDLQSLRYFGRNVKTVDLSRDIPLATLQEEKTRDSDQYAENDDLNGKYRISHPIESDYAYVEFWLKSPRIDDNVFIAGDFSLWSESRPFQMDYLDALQGYYAIILLKQGFYNYQFLTDGHSTKRNYFEGNHFETENEYEILIYLHSFQLDTDLLIGYFPLIKNPRF